MPETAAPCPVCRHSWTAHRGRNGGEHCDWHMGPTGCPCRKKNPDIEAEDRLAGALWRMTVRPHA